MKTKRWLKNSVGIIFIGIAMCIGGYIFGADTYITWHNVHIGIPILQSTTDQEKVSNDDIDVVLEDFEKIDINIDNMDVHIQEGKDYKLKASHLKETEFTYEIKGETLVIRQKQKKAFGIGFAGYEGSFTLELPKEEIENVKIAMGVGEVKLDNLQMETFKLYGGVGAFTAENIECQNTEIQVGVGDVNIEGVLEERVLVTGGVGDVNLTLAGNEKDYNYNLSKGVGDIRINNKTYDAFTNVKENNEGDTDITITGGIGDISVKTK